VVIAGLSYRNAQSGGSPYDSIDIEQVVSTVQMLANRHDSDVMPLSPFISSWDRIIDDVDRLFSEDYVYNSAYRSIMAGVYQAIDGKRPDYNDPDPSRDEFRKEWRKIIEDGRSLAQGGVFQTSYRTMVDFLVQRLKPRAGIDLDYLKPLLTLSHDSLSIYTLNYDTIIEQLCVEQSREVSVGIQGDGRLALQEHINFPESGVRLVKLHGSIDWWWVRYRRAFGLPQVRRLVDGTLSDEWRMTTMDPALIFGQGNKLTVEGPFLELLDFFSRDLEKHDQLIIVGYSFRDPHINHYLFPWFASGERRILIVGGSSFANSTVPFVTQLHSFPTKLIDLKAQAKKGNGIHNAVIEAQSWELQRRNQS